MSGSDLSLERLNQDCFCMSLDERALTASLAQTWSESLASVFSARPVFVAPVHLQRMATVVQTIERVVALPTYRQAVWGQAPAVAQGTRQWSYGALDEAARTLALGLVARGLRRGESVGVLGACSFGLVERGNRDALGDRSAEGLQDFLRLMLMNVHEKSPLERCRKRGALGVAIPHGAPRRNVAVLTRFGMIRPASAGRPTEAPSCRFRAPWRQVRPHRPHCPERRWSVRTT